MLQPPRVAFVIPFLGRLPNYAPLFFRSVATNPCIDVLLFAHHQPEVALPNNVHFHFASRDDILARIKNATGLDVTSINGHKLCDFRPFYASMFEKELTGYDWWGHCDLDVMFGNLDVFMKSRLTPDHDVVTALNNTIVGHFTLYRNSPTVAQQMLAMLANPLFRERFLMADNQMLDEWAAHQHVRDGTSLRLSMPPPLAEGLKLPFAPSGITFMPNGSTYLTPPEYGVAVWEEGRTWYEAAGRPRSEVMYIHFMGNKMWWHWLFYRPEAAAEGTHVFSPIGYGVIRNAGDMRSLRYMLVRSSQMAFESTKVVTGRVLRALFGKSVFRSIRKLVFRSGRYR